MKKKQVLLFTILGILILLPSCGRKGPPFLPRQTTSMKVTQLKGAWTGDAVSLTGTVSGIKARPAGAPATIRCRVYHTRYDLKRPPCDGCPVPFPRYRVVTGTVSQEKAFSCRVSPEVREGIHYFQIRLVATGGALGPPSNRVKIRFPRPR